MSEDLENMEFDKQIKKRYADESVSPPDNMWGKINYEATQLEATLLKQRISFYKWFSFSLITLLIGVSVISQFNNKNEAELANINANETSIRDKNDLLGNEVVEEKHLGNSSVGKNNVSETNSKVALDIVEDNQQHINTNRDFSESTENSDNNYTSNPTDRNNHSNDRSKTKKNKVVSNKAENSIDNETTLSEKTENNTTPLAHKNENSDKVTNEIEKKEPNANFNDTEAKTSNNARNNDTRELPLTTININSDNDKEIIDSLTNVIVDLTNKLAIQDSIFNTDSIIEEPLANTNSAQAPPPIIPEATLSRIIVSALFSPIYSHRSLDGARETFYNKHQVGKFTYSPEINIGYNISNNWIIKVGINYSKLNSDINLKSVFPQEVPIRINTTDESITFFSSLGEVTTAEIDEFEYDEDDLLVDYEERQYVTFINIPIRAEYEIGKKSFKLSLNAGIVTSFILSSESRIKIRANNNSKTDVEIRDFEQTNSFNLGGAVGIGAKYEITKHLSLMFIPSYNRAFTSFIKNDTDKITPYSYNFSIGLQYRF